MRDRPILMSGPMVRALLAGRKTQTRRVVKPPKGYGEVNAVAESLPAVQFSNGTYLKWVDPRYVPGDRLWVRETFMPEAERGENGDWVHDGSYRYRADYQSIHGGLPGLKWKPSIHMPRAACRILLEVSKVGVERVQDITEEDAIAEGVCYSHGDPCRKGPSDPDGAVLCFRRLWDGLNGKRGFGWAHNPWVWVVSFRRLQP